MKDFSEELEEQSKEGFLMKYPAGIPGSIADGSLVKFLQGSPVEFLEEYLVEYLKNAEMKKSLIDLIWLMIFVNKSFVENLEKLPVEL